MKAGIIFTGSGPILILTTFDSLTDNEFAEKLAQKGIKKFIAYEVDIGLCKKRYGRHFSVITEDLQEHNDLRVLDYNGHNVFYLFSFDEFGEPQFKELEDY